MKNELEELKTPGIYPVYKPKGRTSFDLVHALRRHTQIRKIGHTGTLDPHATGVLVLLIGSHFTRQAPHFVHDDKEYEATLHLGVETSTYDAEGTAVATSETVPSLCEIQTAISHFQGKILQVPPMFSAKKVGGVKLYHLARQGKTVERAPSLVELEISLLSYSYPLLQLHVRCSKGAYLRSLAHDLGRELGTGAHLAELIRVRSGQFTLAACYDGTLLFEKISS